MAKIISFLLALALHFGIVAPIKSVEPVDFKDNLKLSFCILSDVHVKDSITSEYEWNETLESMKSMTSDGSKFDALVLGGDLTNLGLSTEYKRLFRCLDKANENGELGKIILSSGNHDMRFAYKTVRKTILSKTREYLGIDTRGKDYYSYELNGYKFIVLGTEKAVMERAHLSDARLAFLDNELSQNDESGKVAFVICHQPLKNTHGLPGVWPTGDLGSQSDKVLKILSSHKNILYINGHLHDGIRSQSLEKLSENVYSLNLPSYGKSNDYGDFKVDGLGYTVEVYENEIIFSARNFKKGTKIDYQWNFGLSDGLEIAK